MCKMHCFPKGEQLGLLSYDFGFDKTKEKNMEFDKF